MINLRVLSCGMTILVVLGVNAPSVEGQADDFAVRFEFGVCRTDILDTFTGVFTKDLGGDPRQFVTIPLTLPEDQVRTIYKAIEEIGFFNLVSPFRGVPSGLDRVTVFGPSSSYRLAVRNGGVVHTVSWNDAFKPTTAEADRLRHLFSMIVGWINEHPEVKRLPPPTGGCE